MSGRRPQRPQQAVASRIQLARRRDRNDDDLTGELDGRTGDEEAIHLETVRVRLGNGGLVRPHPDRPLNI